MTESFEGPGTLTVDGDDYAAVCHLAVTSGRGLKSGRGTLTGDDNTLWKAFGATKASFAFETGRSFPLIVTNFSPGSGAAHFQMAGAFTDT